MVVRRVFPGWSICIPRTFRESFDDDAAYWHGWDRKRSVSLTSFLIIDQDGPVEQEAIGAVLPPPPPGEAGEELPPGLMGWVTDGPAEQPARAQRALSGFLVAHGRALVVTITHGDLAWARSVLRSIQSHPVPLSAEIDSAEVAPSH
jgi:hypothetical protein